MAAENPSMTAPTIHRTGHGIALRTDMRGELMVKRRRNRRNFKTNGCAVMNQALCTVCVQQKRKSRQAQTGRLSEAAANMPLARLALAELLATAC
jgi:hypothetical protein